MIRERAYAKLNLVLHVGAPGADGLHPLCSLFASIDLADEIVVAPGPGPADEVSCPGVEGPNLAAAAIAAFRERVPGELPPLSVEIAKRIPVAGGLGGGSADAAAVLRAVNRLAGEPLGAPQLRELGRTLGSDVPSQIDPGHALVEGTGERVMPIELPAMTVVLVPRAQGLSTAAVYAELDRRGGWRAELDPEPLLELARGAPAALAAGLENDLEPAALGLRPELGQTVRELREAGALGAQVSGSGPTCFGLFAGPPQAERAAGRIEGAMLAELRSP
jgi:4-diphosphocytidyl-2-C-methyl-D-erythritol kinase